MNLLNEFFVKAMKLATETKFTVTKVIKSKLKKSGIKFMEYFVMNGTYFVDIYIESGKYDIILRLNHEYDEEADMKIIKKLGKNTKVIYFNYGSYKDKLGIYHEPLYKDDTVNYKELYRIHYIVYFLYKHGCNFNDVSEYKPFNIKYTGNIFRMFHDGMDSKIFTKKVRKDSHKIVHNYYEWFML